MKWFMYKVLTERDTHCPLKQCSKFSVLILCDTVIVSDYKICEVVVEHFWVLTSAFLVHGERRCMCLISLKNININCKKRTFLIQISPEFYFCILKQLWN